jgi:hypothetical protein
VVVLAGTATLPPAATKDIDDAFRRQVLKVLRQELTRGSSA